MTSDDTRKMVVVGSVKHNSSNSFGGVASARFLTEVSRRTGFFIPKAP